MTLNHEETYSRRWWIASAVLIGTWIGTLSNSLVPVALPSILGQYDVGLNLGVWVISVYVLFFAVPNPIFGWLGDRHGFRRIYIVGMTGLVFCSWAATLAPTIGWLIFFRAVQGLCNAMILASVMGIISQVFPGHERGVAMGAWATVNGAAHGLGPVISGFLVQTINWQATFWFVSVITALGVAVAYWTIPSDQRHHSRPFDLLGAAALTLAMLTFMFVLTQGGELGWGSWLSLSLWGAFAALMILFILREARIPHPFVDLRLFTNRRYTAVTAIISAQFFCLFGLQLLLPLYLIQLRGFAAGVAGLLVAPLASTLALVSPLAGRTADRLGYQTAMIAGMAFVALSGGSMAFWDTNTPAWLIVVTLIAMGVGMGFTQSPAASGVTLIVREAELGVALGIFNMLRFVSGTLGATIFGIVVAYARLNNVSPLFGFHTSFYLVTVVAAVAVLLAVTMPRPPRPRTVTAVQG
jgi:EmrB/QacA subfamily drug resistance transporter